MFASFNIHPPGFPFSLYCRSKTYKSNIPSGKDGSALSIFTLVNAAVDLYCVSLVVVFPAAKYQSMTATCSCTPTPMDTTIRARATATQQQQTATATATQGGDSPCPSGLALQKTAAVRQGYQQGTFAELELCVAYSFPMSIPILSYMGLQYPSISLLFPQHAYRHSISASTQIQPRETCIVHT